MVSTFIPFGQGILLGIAMIIPGVSGGTMALTLGIYERLIQDFNRFQPSRLRLFFPPYPDGMISHYRRMIQELDLVFLSKLGMGILLVTIFFANFMRFLLNTYPLPTYSFFWGLILASVPVPFRQIQKKSLPVFFSLFCGILVTLYFGHQLVRSNVSYTQQKLEIHRGKNVKNSSPFQSISTNSSFKNRSLFYFLYVAIGGAIGTAACVLPGISGSFTLLLMGLYFDILQSIVNLSRGHFSLQDLGILLMAGLGGVIGLILFARVMEIFLKRFPDTTMASLTGLLIGSLYPIWPFREVVSLGPNQGIVLGLPFFPNFQTPYFGVSLIMILISILLGLGIDRLNTSVSHLSHPIENNSSQSSSINTGSNP